MIGSAGAGWAAGTLVYLYIAVPLGDVIDHIVNSWSDKGSAATPAPYSHADERDALNTPPGSDCETLKYSIMILKAMSVWRGTDLNSLHKGTAIYTNHQKRIAILNDKIAKLEKEYSEWCKDKCDK